MYLRTVDRVEPVPAYTSDKASGAAEMPANIGDGVRRTRRELVVGGLSERDARALLDSVPLGRLDQRVRDRVVSESRGNPLSLLALARGLAPAELAGGFALPDVMPLVNRIEQSSVRRLESLPAPTRRLLLIAAAEPQPTPGRGRYGSMCVPSRALRVT
jgi:hypothetical protein